MSNTDWIFFYLIMYTDYKGLLSQTRIGFSWTYSVHGLKSLLCKNRLDFHLHMGSPCSSQPLNGIYGHRQGENIQSYNLFSPVMMIT